MIVNICLPVSLSLCVYTSMYMYVCVYIYIYIMTMLVLCIVSYTVWLVCFVTSPSKYLMCNMSDVILRCTCYPMTYLSHLSHHIDMFYTYSNTELQRRQDSVVRYISIQSPLPYHSYPRLQDLAMPISINLIKYMSHHFYQHYTHYDYQCYQCLFLSRPFLSILNAAPGQVCTYSTELPASTLSQRARRCSQPLRWAGHSAVLGNRHYPYICIYIYI